jgi:hypothetical protein
MFCYCSFSLFEIFAYSHDTAGWVTNKIRADVTTAGQRAQKAVFASNVSKVILANGA